jgi:CubicO group peptidase (beta-lactamase class C family)
MSRKAVNYYQNMRYYRVYLLLCICLVCCSGLSMAQGQQQKNENAFKLVRNYIDKQVPDSIYDMLNDDFRMKISRPSFDGVFTNSVFPLGGIKEYTFVKLYRDISDYKVSFGNFVMVMRIGIDKAGKIFALEFQPYKEHEPQKAFAVNTTNPLQTAADKKVDSIARTYIMKLNTVGLSIGILKDGKMTTYGYGETVKGNGKIPGGNTIFEIGSITKVFTSTLLAYYANEKKVVLDYPVTKYLPDSVAKNVNLSVVSLLMLSNHTSGLPRMPENWAQHVSDSLNPLKDYKKRDLYSYLKTAKLEAIPGQTYMYSNLGAGILATIMERISGKSFEQMVKQTICTPLNMSNTVQHLSPEQKGRFVTGYDDNGQPVKAWDMDALAGAGALRSTANDLLLFAQANMKEDDSKLGKAAKLTQKITFDKKPTVGMGWFQDMINEDAYYWHNGATAGNYSYMAFMPGKKIAVVVLSNSVKEVDPVGEEILRALDTNP